MTPNRTSTDSAPKPARGSSMDSKVHPKDRASLVRFHSADVGRRLSFPEIDVTRTCHSGSFAARTCRIRSRFRYKAPNWRREIESRSNHSILVNRSQRKQTAEEAGSYWQVIEDGGERGIRTPGTVSRSAVFKTACLNHSHISPQLFT
jgi:hypothetical protein